MNTPRVLLIVGGGIAAYKACELVRLIRKGGAEVTCVLTEGGTKFVTPLALAALSENPVHTTLWDLKNEVEMGHIQLSRQADLVVVCPATANMLAKMAAGIADDLATTLLLATDKPVLAVPAMNVRMWQHAATMLNVQTLRAAGVDVMEPDEGAMACGEFGPGRLPEPPLIWRRIAADLGIAVPDEHVAGFRQDVVDEPEEEEASGLAGLSGLIIPRSTPLRDQAEHQVPWLPEPEIEPLPAFDPQELPPLVLGGPLLSKKGKARSAPPTDGDAINHLVSVQTDAALPEPFLPDALPSYEPPTGQNVEQDSPLVGQPDFDLEPQHRPLFGKHLLVTAGPTHEPIDPVRYIANRSSGRQGYAIAAAAAEAGARVTLVSGPVNLPTPPGVDRIDVETATEMAEAVKSALPVDVAIMVAAVADWRTKQVAGNKMKKRGSAPPTLMLTENPDILATVAAGRHRPKLLIGFAAETENVLENATEKRKRKAVDWIVANDVSGTDENGVMGGSSNTVHIVTSQGIESLPKMAKDDVAKALVERIASAL